MTQNSINNQSSSLTVDNLLLDGNTIGSTSGSIEFQSDGTNDIIFNDGTNDTLVIADSGESVRQYQPMFNARNTSVQNNVTGDGTEYTCEYTTEIFDVGTNFSSPNFTAPVTGKYLFQINIRWNALTSSMTSGIMKLITSNRTIYKFFNPADLSTGNGVTSINYDVVTDMDATDTAYVTGTIDGGTKVAGYSGIGSASATSFTGGLIS